MVFGKAFSERKIVCRWPSQASGTRLHTHYKLTIFLIYKWHRLEYIVHLTD